MTVNVYLRRWEDLIVSDSQSFYSKLDLEESFEIRWYFRADESQSRMILYSDGKDGLGSAPDKTHRALG
jgi:hypothetical protein